LDAGADIDAKDNNGITPLHIVVTTSGLYQIAAPDVARLLIERG
jgi:ankyrin repeat protein